MNLTSGSQVLLPSMLEAIVRGSGSKYYFLFESGSKKYCGDIDWDKLSDIVSETTNNRKVMGFRQDKCIIVENRTLSNKEVTDYLTTETAPIHLDNLNKALEPINIKLEFIEAIDNPFPLDGFQNFVRFKVVELD